MGEISVSKNHGTTVRRRPPRFHPDQRSFPAPGEVCYPCGAPRLFPTVCQKSPNTSYSQSWCRSLASATVRRPPLCINNGFSWTPEVSAEFREHVDLCATVAGASLVAELKSSR